jgi:hypothetical protein
LAHRFEKPRAGKSPKPVRFPPADAHELRGLLMTQAGEIPQVHQPGGVGIFHGQLLQGFVQGQQLIGWEQFCRG